MPVKIIDCDIFKAPIDVIGHCSNCQNTMGSGVALEIKNRFPEAYAADCKTEKGDRKKLGTFTFAFVDLNGKPGYVFNLYAQFEFGGNKRHLNYEALYRCLENMRDQITNKNLVIGFPYKMGSDRAGGDFQVVEAMIRSVFEKSTFNVLICKL